MKLKGLWFVAVCFVCVWSLAASAQTEQEYKDPTGQYKLTLYGDWRAVSYNDAVGRPKTEFVYRDRAVGLLKISKESLSGQLADMVRQEEESQRIYRAGFERASSEPFGGGALSGMRLSFYSTESGRQTANTFYFLQDKTSVYILRFTGKRGALDTIRNLTDQVARSFQPTAKS